MTEGQMTKTCETCALYLETTDEEGLSRGRTCFDPACHGPESEGVNNHWAAELPQVLKELAGQKLSILQWRDRIAQLAVNLVDARRTETEACNEQALCLETYSATYRRVTEVRLDVERSRTRVTAIELELCDAVRFYQAAVREDSSTT